MQYWFLVFVVIVLLVSLGDAYEGEGPDPHQF